MKKIIGHVRTNKVGSTTGFHFFVDDDATDEEIEDEAKKCMFNCIEWDWKEDYTYNNKKESALDGYFTPHLRE